MATSDQEQKGINVPQHKRMAMGAPITGQNMPNGNNTQQQQKGALSQVKKK